MKRSRQSGFTLVEMLLASLVLAIGLLAVFSLFPVASAMSRESRDRQRARAFADSVFTALEWQFAGVGEDVALRLPTEMGPKVLGVATNQVWPIDLSQLTLADVPRWTYSLALASNANGSVDADLTLRVQGSPLNASRRYERTFWPVREAW